MTSNGLLNLGLAGSTVEPPSAGRISSGLNAESRIAATNRALVEAGSHFWIDDQSARETATRLFAEFGATAAALEALGWPAARIQEHLRPSRQVFATSAFMRRCQEWPRGYAGDFETIEYLAAGTNYSEPGTLGWHFEEILLHSAVVEQHRNKLRLQSWKSPVP